MAKDKDKGKPKRPRRTPLGPIRVVRSNRAPPPKTNEPRQGHPDGVIDKDRVKEIFMKSKFVEWTPFAQSMNWDPVRSRSEYPTAEWIQLKKDQLARTQAETIAQMVFDHRGKWHKDVLTTLTESPAAADAMLGIIKHRMNQMVQMINDDMVGVKSATAEKPYEVQFSPKNVKNSDLLSLTVALKTAIEAKHKALLIGDWNIKVTEQFTDPAQFQKEDNKLKDHEWSIEVMGGDKIKGHEMQRLMWEYIDKPKDVVQIEAAVDPNPPGPKEEDPPPIDPNEPYVGPPRDE